MSKSQIAKKIKELTIGHVVFKSGRAHAPTNHRKKYIKALEIMLKCSI